MYDGCVEAAGTNIFASRLFNGVAAGEAKATSWEFGKHGPIPIFVCMVRGMFKSGK
jgi:hypothetical protein